MLTLEQRALAVLTRAWQLLPPRKTEAVITAVHLEDLGAKHGSFDPETCIITLSTRLFEGDTPEQLMSIDLHGESPALCEPFCSRALHTASHELSHAIGYATGLDESEEWLALSGWDHTDEDLQTTGRYTERRPGWGTWESPWRYTKGTWFCRSYASSSPHEDFADCVTHLALGWVPFGTSPSAHQKLRYLRRTLFQETGTRYLAAVTQRYQRQLQARCGTGARKGEGDGRRLHGGMHHVLGSESR